MITFTQRGNFNNTEKMLRSAIRGDYASVLAKYGQEGVAALSAATPKRTGLTANSWYYDIETSGNTASIVWKNSNVSTGVNVAVILQYGHATKNGGYVQGIDYINPALAPIFDKIADAAWKEVCG